MFIEKSILNNSEFIADKWTVDLIIIIKKKCIVKRIKVIIDLFKKIRVFID